MFYDRHGAAPPPEIFERLKWEVPNVSGRMDDLRAAILRPQLATLAARCAAWTERYRAVEAGLRGTPGLTLIERPEAERFVGSSFQCLLLDWPAEAVAEVVARAGARGVELKWFGEREPRGYTSRYDSWRFAAAEAMPATDRVLAGLLDMRLPLTFSLADCALIARILREEIGAVAARGGAAAE
jgi:dTDP-4-amino-4,6-dideoxygalactose transaminase